jgi:hypothetical protein
MLLEDGADRGGVCLGDSEHRWSMGRHVVAGNCQELLRRPAARPQPIAARRVQLSLCQSDALG